MSRLSAAVRVLLFGLLLAGYFTRSFGQSSQGYLNDIGSPAYSLQIPVENGYIDASNGNLHLEFPLSSPPQRGALTVSERLAYDSRIWQFLPFGSHGSYHWWPYNVPGSSTSSGGWRLITSGEIGSVTFPVTNQRITSCGNNSGNNTNGTQTYQEDNEDGPANGDLITTTSSVVWTDPTGSEHPFNASLTSFSDDCDSTQDSRQLNGGYATDGSGYQVPSDPNGSVRIIDNRGTQVYPSIIDRYGNQLSSDPSGNLVDDTGRIPVVATQNGNVTYYDVVSPGSAGRVRYTVTTAPVNVSTNFIAFKNSDIYSWVSSSDLNPVQSILLPDGVSKYTFSYDINGEMSSMTLPTGGVIHYGYIDFVDSANTENNWLAAKKLDTAPAMTFTPQVGTQCANYGTGCTEYVTYHKPSGDESVFELTLTNGAWNTATFVYTGAVPQRSSINSRPAPAQNLLASQINTNQYSNACSSPNCAGANYLITSFTSNLLYAGGTLNAVSQSESFFDSISGKLGALLEWDLVNSASINSFTSTPAALPTRHTQYNYTGFDLTRVQVQDRSGSIAGITNYVYTPNAVQTSGLVQHGTQNAGGPYLSAVSHWVNTDPSHPSTVNYTMDDSGMVQTVQDPDGHPPTSIAYQCANSLPLSSTNALNQVSQYGYDCPSGASTSIQDPNDLASSRAGTTYLYDSLGRPQLTSRPDGGTTTYTYPSINEVDTAVSTGRQPLTSSSIVDAYGRPSASIASGIETDTSYDVNGRVYCTTNPFFTGSPNGSTCITARDGLDRPLNQILSDGVSSLSWSYSAVGATPSDGRAANVTTSTDERQVSWSRFYDAFGELIGVVEPGPAGSLSTFYHYDGLGNTTTVTQNGTPNQGDTPQTRSFTYDSLSRLVCASNPESAQAGGNQPTCPASATGSLPSGATLYTYNPSGSIATKTDARGAVTTYTYEALGRLNYKTYTTNGAISTTPVAAYGYDGNNEMGSPLAAAGIPSFNAIGRLSSISNQVNAAKTYSYDPMGRTALQRIYSPNDQGFSTQVSANYDQVGNITDLFYPDGRHILQGFDSLSRLSSSTWVGNTTSVAMPPLNFVSSINYFPDGSPQVLNLNNGLITQSFTEDSRLRVHDITVSAPQVAQPLLWHTYCYTNCATGGAGDNGTIWGITDNLNAGRTQGFTYDSLNRITSFSLGGVQNQQYQTDSFGNLSGISNGQAITNFSSSNRILNLGCAASAAPYDQAGNQLCDTDPVSGGVRVYSYDAENRMASFTPLNSSSTIETFTYGADGSRVERLSNPTNTYTDYLSFGGQIIAEKRGTVGVNNGVWTDYIFAGGRRVARFENTDNHLHFSGTAADAGSWVAWRLPSPANYVVNTGDKLCWRQYQSGTARGGIVIGTDKTLTAWTETDQDGQISNDDAVTGQWHQRTMKLDRLAGGTLEWINIDGDQNSSGNWTADYADISLVTANGTVIPLYSGQATSLAVSGGNGGMTNVQQSTSAIPEAGSPGAAYFLLADHLGSAALEFAAGGLPVAQSEFAPFGQQLDSQTSNTNYKFTGLEHDSQTNLEHADFRELASVQGRWMSVDPYDGSMDPNDPQSFNRYAYVVNRPLNFADPLGLFPCPGYPDADCDLTNTRGRYHPDSGDGSSSLIIELVTAGISDLIGAFHHPSFRESHVARPTDKAPNSGLNGVGPNPCSGANPASLNYQAVNPYNKGADTAFNHIFQNHILGGPGKSVYAGGPGGTAGAVGNMFRLNALTLVQGTLVQPSVGGIAVLSYYEAPGSFGPFSWGNVGTSNGQTTQYNTLVVKNCTVPQTSYPGLPSSYQP